MNNKQSTMPIKKILRTIENERARNKFLIFCIEMYKNACHLSGTEVAEMFVDKGVDKYLYENYDVLHTQGANYLIQDIEEYIKN